MPAGITHILRSRHELLCTVPWCSWEDYPNPINDVEGYWLCKNSWGTGWGLRGNVKIAYGAAGIISPNPAYGLLFEPDLERHAENIAAAFRERIQIDSADPLCVLYTPSEPLRLIKLVNNLRILSLAVAIAAIAPPLDERTIIGDVVAANLGVPSMSLSAASTGPFRMCGETRNMLAALVPLPTKPVSNILHPSIQQPKS
jgi:hypothetical protein